MFNSENFNSFIKKTGFITDPIIIIMVALIYNAFFHKLTQILYGGLPFNENKTKSVQALLIIGIISLVLYKLHVEGSLPININKNIIKAVKYGGLLLLFSAIMNNWTGMDETVKLLLLGTALVAIVYFTREKNKEIKEN